MKFMPEDVFEEFIGQLKKKFPKLGEDDVRRLAIQSLKEGGVTVGVPLVEKIRQAQVCTGEQVVMENLRQHGLLDDRLKGGG